MQMKVHMVMPACLLMGPNCGQKLDIVLEQQGLLKECGIENSESILNIAKILFFNLMDFQSHCLTI